VVPRPKSVSLITSVAGRGLRFRISPILRFPVFVDLFDAMPAKQPEIHTQDNIIVKIQCGMELVTLAGSQHCFQTKDFKFCYNSPPK